PDADYFRNGTGLLAHARPGGKRDLLCEWQILRVPDRLPRSFERIDGHRVGGRNSAHHLARWKARDVHYTPGKPQERTLGVGHRWWQQSEYRQRRKAGDRELGSRQFSFVF